LGLGWTVFLGVFWVMVFLGPPPVVPTPHKRSCGTPGKKRNNKQGGHAPGQMGRSYRQIRVARTDKTNNQEGEAVTMGVGNGQREPGG